MDQVISYIKLILFVFLFGTVKQTDSQINLDFEEEDSFSKTKVEYKEELIENPGLKNEQLKYGSPVNLEVEKEEGVSKIENTLKPSLILKDASYKLKLISNFYASDNGLLNLKKLGREEGFGFRTYAMHVSKEDAIYVGLANGFAVIKGNEARIYNVLSGLDGNFVQAIAETKAGIWLSSYGGGLYLFKDGDIKVFTKESGLSNNFITNLYTDENGDLNLTYYGDDWARIAGDRITNFSFKNNLTLTLACYKDECYLSGANSYQVYNKDRNSLSFIKMPQDRSATFIRLLKFDNKLIGLSEDGRLYEISGNELTEMIWSEKDIISISADSTNLWALTKSGKVCLIDKKRNVQIYQLKKEINFSDSEIHASDGRLFIRHQKGLFLHLPSKFGRVTWDKDYNNILQGVWFIKGEFYYPHKEGLAKYNPISKETILLKCGELRGIRDLKEYDGKLHISTLDGLFVFGNNKLEWIHSNNPSLNSFGSIEVYDGKLWLANFYFGFITYDGAKLSTFKSWYQAGETHPGYTLRKFPDGSLALSSGKGFGVIKDDKLNIYNSNNSKLSPGKIYSSIAFGDSTFIGGQGGLFLLHNGNIKQLFKNDISYDGIMDFVLLKEKVLILCREKILIFDRNEKRISNTIYDIGLGDGFLSYDSHLLIDETVYFATGSSIIEYQPDKIVESRSPKLTYSTIEINGEQVENDSLALFQKANKIVFKGASSINFSLEFNATYLGRESDLNYYYSLDSDEWKGPFSSNRLDFTDLGFGEHHIRIKAESINGDSSNILDYHFTLQKMFYQKTWFWALIVGVIGVIALLIYWRTRDFKMEKMAIYLDGSLLNSKIKVSSFFGAILLPAIEFLHTTYYELYKPLWPVIITISILAFFVYISARYRAISNKFLYAIVVIVYFAYSAILISRVFESDYNMVLTGEMVIVIVLSCIILEKVKQFILYALFIILAASITLIIRKDIGEDFLTFVSIGGQAIILSALFFSLEERKFKQIIFANKIVKNSKNYIISSNLKGEVVYINDYMAEVLGYPAHELLGNDYWEKLNRTDQEKEEIKANLRKTIDSNEPITYENFLATKEGLRRVNWTDTVVDKKYLIGIGKDITDEYHARLRSKELNEIIERATDIIFKSDRVGNFIYVNDAAAQLTGYTMDELVNITYRDLTHEDDLEKVDEYCRGVIDRKEKHGYVEFRIKTKSGRIKWVGQSLITRFNEETEYFEGFSSILRDKTEQKFHELQLERLSLVAEKTTNTVIIFNTSGAVEWVNKSFEKDFGFTEEDILGKHPSEILHDKTDVKEVERLEKLNLDLSQGKNHTAEFEMLTSTGKKWFNVSIDPVYNDIGEVIKYVGILSDFSAIKAQQKLIETQNKNIVDSINYAKRIQKSVLPQKDTLEKLFPNALFYLKQKDTIGGDFYWVDIIDNRHLILVGADCTGHGVPGAFMTLLGTSALDSIVGEKREINPGKILDYVHEKLVDSVGTGSSEEQVSHDGMEMAVLSIDLEEQELKYAGSGRPLIKIDDSKDMTEFDPVRYTLGDIFTEKPNFEEHTIKIENECQYFLFSDGLHDQFGGERNRKYSKRKFKELLTRIAFKESAEQREEIQIEMKQWSIDHGYPQTDDQLLIGLRLSDKFVKSLKKKLDNTL